MSTENNKLIAEFMGLPKKNGRIAIRPDSQPMLLQILSYANKINPNDRQLTDRVIFGDKMEPILFYLNPDELLYDTSWDWLMPVVEKITVLSTQDYESDIYGEYMGRFEIIDDCFMSANIEVIYKTIIEFIKWYNKNKKGEK